MAHAENGLPHKEFDSKDERKRRNPKTIWIKTTTRRGFDEEYRYIIKHATLNTAGPHQKMVQ